MKDYVISIVPVLHIACICTLFYLLELLECGLELIRAEHVIFSPSGDNTVSVERYIVPYLLKADRHENMCSCFLHQTNIYSAVSE
jgi:hypothetical protein